MGGARLAPHTANYAPAALTVLAPIVVLAIFIQIFVGALVAGLDAGLAFNDWPTMDGSIVPQGLLVLEPAWRNFFENPKTVQFVHRISGYVLVVLVIVQWLASRAPSTPAPHRVRAAILMWLALAQAALGILTLVWQVPLPLALAHQAGAAILLGFAVAHWRAIHGTYAPLTGIEIRS